MWHVKYPFCVLPVFVYAARKQRSVQDYAHTCYAQQRGVFCGPIGDSSKPPLSDRLTMCNIGEV